MSRAPKLKQEREFRCECPSACQYRVRVGYGYLCQICVAAGCEYRPGLIHGERQFIRRAHCPGGEVRQDQINLLTAKRDARLALRERRRAAIIGGPSTNNRIAARALRVRALELRKALACVREELARNPVEF